MKEKDREANYGTRKRLCRHFVFGLHTDNLFNDKANLYLWSYHGAIVGPINPLVRAEGRDGPCIHSRVLRQHAQSKCYITFSKDAKTTACTEGNRGKNGGPYFQPECRTFLSIRGTEITIIDKLNGHL